MKKYLLFFLAIGIGFLFYFNNDKSVKIETATSDEIKLDGLTGAEKLAMYQSLIRQSPEGSPYRYKSGYQTKEYEKLKKRIPDNPSRNLVWEERGPGNVSGRTRTVWIDPRDETGETWFVGSVQGGVWKTEDGGQSYAQKTPNVPHLGTAAIMGCKSVPEVIYAGSGEGFNFLSVAGAGIYKSVDGGETWTVLESTTNNESFANVMRLAVHPENPDIILAATRNNNSAAATDGFVMRSTDGGETWEEVLNHFDEIPHILMSPENADVIYAALNREGVLKSVDGGDNWDFVWLFETPELRPERIELAISDFDPNYVYFTTPINDVSTFEGDQIFVSDNAGESFTLITPNTEADDYSEFSGGQSFWNKTIAVDPFNPLKIYFGGQSALLSLDVTIVPGLAVGELSVISDGYNSYRDFFETSTKGVHVDHHGIFFSVVDSATQEVIMINSNDGGIAVSRDNGATFTQTGDTFLQGFNPEGGTWTTVDGYNVSTFYGVDKMNGSDRYVGGTQDNGSWVSPEDPDAASRWSYAPSGDGFEAAWNYNDPNLIIETSQGNNLWRSQDGGETWENLETPGFGPFITALANSKQDGDMVMISTNQGPALSTDFGSTWTVSDVPGQYEFSGLRTPIEISLVDPNVVWTGTRVDFNRRICLSRDGGQTFEATAPYTLQNLGEVAGIATHPADPSIAYAVFGTAGNPKVIRTTDWGETWVDISGFEGSIDGTSSRGFPDVAVFSLLVMPYDTNIIWAGTEIGIVESLDNGETWNLIDDDLPATAIWEMKVVNDEVVLATHGRGIWTTTLSELEGYEPPVPFLVASKFRGDIFDKDMTGIIKHLTPIDSGIMTITVETPDSVFSRDYPIGAVAAPSDEELNIDLEDFDIGDFIYEAEISITSYREGSSQTRTSNRMFYDVDLDDPVQIYSEDFNDGNEDFAVGRVVNDEADFNVGAPNGFDNNGFESNHNFDGSNVYRTIFQKPIVIPETGLTISFDEIVILNPAQETSFGTFYSESVILEASNNRGKSWVRLAEYSAEHDPAWRATIESFSPPTSDLYRNRRIILSDIFEEGDEVFFKIEMDAFGFFGSWGYILDNLFVEPTNSTKEELEAVGISAATFMNPFRESTTIKVTHPSEFEVGNIIFTSINGQVYNDQVNMTKVGEGTVFQIDGMNLHTGAYLLKVNIGNNIITEKVIKI